MIISNKYARPGDSFPGKIPECPSKGCNFKCCKFDLGNYIVMYPGELEMERQKGLSDSHLEIIEQDYLMEGGLKVKCNRLCTKNDIKPLDCKIYPLWYKGNNSFISGAKCPLPETSIWRHAIITKYYLNGILAQNPELEGFFRDTQMVGYSDIKIPDLQQVSIKDYLDKHKSEYLLLRYTEMRRDGLSPTETQEHLIKLGLEMDSERDTVTRILQVNK